MSLTSFANKKNISINLTPANIPIPHFPTSLHEQPSPTFAVPLHHNQPPAVYANPAKNILLASPVGSILSNTFANHSSRAKQQFSSKNQSPSTHTTTKTLAIVAAKRSIPSPWLNFHNCWQLKHRIQQQMTMPRLLQTSKSCRGRKPY
jgi:hypothetical protein